MKLNINPFMTLNCISQLSDPEKQTAKILNSSHEYLVTSSLIDDV